MMFLAYMFIVASISIMLFVGIQCVSHEIERLRREGDK